MGATSHGHRVGGKRSPTYVSWDSMIARCCRPSHPYYPIYGGRGVRVWPAWRGNGGFARFLADVGERPAGMTLDRIDVEGDYEPSNVRWATPLQQRWNRRDMIAAAETLTPVCPSSPSTPAAAMPF